jgi:PleD family two-component response regulator
MEERMTYKIVILDGNLGDVEAEMNALAAEGYRLREVVHAATATSPCTTFKPLAIMERAEESLG